MRHSPECKSESGTTPRGGGPSKPPEWGNSDAQAPAARCRPSCGGIRPRAACHPASSLQTSLDQRSYLESHRRRRWFTPTRLANKWVIKSPYFVISLVVMMLSAALVQAQEVQVSASVSTDTISAQDQLQFSVTVTGKESGDSETPRLPRLQGFQVVAGPSVSTQFQWINGRTSSTKSFIWILLPEKEGQLTIDPVEVRVGKKTYKTEPVSVRVTAGSGQPARPRPRPFDPFEGEDTRPRARSGGDELFVTAELDRSSVYPGQQVTLSYHLYTQVGVTGIQLQENPPLTGFWVENLEVPPNPTGSRKIVNGREYLEFVIKKQALFPNAAGQLKIPSSTFAVSAKSAGDFFGLFGQSETLYRKTKEITLEVKALPLLERPSNFGNAVGSFNLTSNVDKNEVATGEAITLRVKLSGRGNLKTVPDIPLPAMPDFTVYSSKSTENVRPFEGNLIGGDKTWEYVIVPKAPGEQTIPPLSMSYFDPEREKYETVSSPSLSIRVVRGLGIGNPLTTFSGLTKQNLTRQGTDINFIKLGASDLDTPSEPPYRTAWFYLFATLPVAFNIGALLYQRERAKQSENAVLTRSQRARRTALQLLRKAEKSGRADPRRFYDEAAAALSGYLTDKFNLPGIAVTGDTLERTLAEKSVSEKTVAEILGCVQECDFGRFVSSSGSSEKMGQISSRIRKTIDTLERL